MRSPSVSTRMSVWTTLGYVVAIVIAVVLLYCFIKCCVKESKKQFAEFLEVFCCLDIAEYTRRPRSRDRSQQQSRLPSAPKLPSLPRKLPPIPKIPKRGNTIVTPARVTKPKRKERGVDKNKSIKGAFDDVDHPNLSLLSTEV